MKKDNLLTFKALLIIFIIYPFSVRAQIVEEITFDPSVRTILLHPTDNVLNPPIINFNSGEQLLLSFDYLDAGYISWQYTFIHCNADWTPTDLWQNEYLDGYTDDYIKNYTSSFNTLQSYTHYSVTIPNQSISLRLPGNYIVKVYPDGDPENPIFTRRFMVVDKKVTVKGTVKRATDIDKRFTHQEVAFSILHPQYTIYQPYSELKVVVLQNMRWDNALFNIKPLMLRDGEIDYQYTDGTIQFEGLNEFRYFDIKSLRYATERVRAIEIRNDSYIVDLVHDQPRAFKPYITDQDINGRFLVKTDDGDDVSDEGEYALVNFFIPVELPYPGGEVFVIGGFNDWMYNESITPDRGRMKYNYARQGYEARLLLKQGYYNYLYGLVDKSGNIDFSQLEGNHSETGNLYTILVYNREQGARFDTLIAVEFLEK